MPFPAASSAPSPIPHDAARVIFHAFIGAGMLATMSPFARLPGDIFGPVEVMHVP